MKINKQKELGKIAKEIESCSMCKKGKSGRAVPGEGNPDADIVFVGEAPGKTEAETGRPFVGRSGQFLRSLIRKIGLKEENVYITSPVKYLPAGRQGLPGGTPSILDIAHGRTHLQKQLDIIQPKIIVLLGSVAAFGVLGDPSAPLRARKIAVLKLHGTIIDKNDKSYFVTLHPSAGIRFPILRKLIEKDFQKLKTLLS